MPVLGARKEKALETRRRMLKAAYTLFCRHGYVATTMDAIAKEAGVAVQTLYFTFHTKAAVLEECVGAGIIGFERWVPPQDSFDVDAADPDQLRQWHPWFRPFEEERDAEKALAIFVDASAPIMERLAPLIAVLNGANGDPEAKRNNEVAEKRRVESYGLVVAMLAKKKGGLRHGLTVKRGTDILLTLLSGDVWNALATSRGWSTKECRNFLVDALIHALLP
jgi:AcrR family transcriptional regulator